MGKTIKKIVAGIMFVAIIVCQMSPITAKADSGSWIANADGSVMLQGTNITAKLFYGKLVIDGNGAIPDYTPMTYSQRPWHNWEFKTLSIGSGITEIGSFAFGDKTCIERVEIPSTTFLKDATSFFGMSQDVVFRVKGSQRAWKNYGTIGYSSFESLAYGFYRNIFIMDTPEVADIFRCLHYPFMKYVYCEKDSSQPWINKVDITENIQYSALSKISSDTPLGWYWQMYTEMKTQSSVYMNCMKDLIGDYTYVCTYEMSLLNKEGIVYGTDAPVKYVLNIPKAEQSCYKQFRLIEVGPNGTVFFLDDLDTKDDTITFSTIYPTSRYALVYKYDMSKLTPYIAK